MLEPITSRTPRHVVVLAHPDPHSFNAMIAATYCETVRACGQEAVLRDLYAMGFDPLLRNSERPGVAGAVISRDVEDELDVIRNGDVFVLVYPIWFGMPPAIMKGYVDRVLGAGVTARDIQDRAGKSVLSGKRLMTITSSGASEIWLDEQAQVESLRNVFARYLSHAFGMKTSKYLHFGHIIEGHPQNFVAQNIIELDNQTRQICKAVADDAVQSRSGLVLASS